MPWFRDKTNQIWVWVKGKWVVVVAAIAILGSGTVAVILQEDPILQDHLLKATPEKILLSKEVDWIEKQLDGTFINKGKIIKYDYISDTIVNRVIYGGIQEDMSKRTGNAQYFKKSEKIKNEIKTTTWVTKVYSGTPFYYIPYEDKWYQTETATTTIDAFDKQTKQIIFEKMFGAFAATATTTYVGAVDGAIRSDAQKAWDTAHDSTSENATGAAGTPVVRILTYTNTTYRIYRAFFPFYTAGIPAAATITTSTFWIYTGTIENDDNDGNDFIRLVETFQISTTTYSDSDFEDVGYDSGNETGGRAKFLAVAGAVDRDLTGIASDAYLSFDDWNATGLGWIKKAGQASTCGSGTGWTCLGFREGHDVVDDPMTVAGTNQYNGMPWLQAETAGTGQDPYLTIEYTEVVAGIIDVTPRNVNLY